MSIAKLRVSTTIQHIYKLARDVAVVVEFIRDKPKCLRIMKDILKIAYFARKTRACIPTHSLYIYIYIHIHMSSNLSEELRVSRHQSS